jgi:hypothetical protein
VDRWQDVFGAKNEEEDDDEGGAVPVWFCSHLVNLCRKSGMGMVIKQAGKTVHEPSSQLHLYAEGGLLLIRYLKMSLN